MALFDDLATIQAEMGGDKPFLCSVSGSSERKSPPSGSDTYTPTHGNSTSDDDQLTVDDRKQRRMLSNRESARRSRLRKQQHLDELRSHVAQLRVQNSQMLSSFSLTSKRYAQVAEENQILRSEAMNLNHQLQLLHDNMAAQQCPREFAHSPEGVRQLFESNQLGPFS